MKYLLLLLLALSAARCAQQVYSVKQELLQDHLRKNCDSKIQNSMIYQKWEDKDFEISEKSGAFFYTQENKVEGWKIKKFGYSSLEAKLLAKENGTLSVSLKEVYLQVESNYASTVYVDWLKNSTGKVTFQLTSDMDFDFSVALDSQGNAKATAKSVQGLRIKEESVNATMGDAAEEVGEALAVLFSKRGGPVLMSVRDKLQNYLDEGLDAALTKVKKDTDYVLPNNYAYKVVNTPSRVGILQDGQFTVYLQSDVYYYSSKISKEGHAVSHTAMGNSSSSLLEYEVDQSLVELGIVTYFNTLTSTTHKFDNKDFGKIFKNYYGDNSYDAMHEVFQMDPADYMAKSGQYQVGVKLVKDSASVSFKNSSLDFQVEVSLLSKQGYSVSHPRKFELDLSASLSAFVDGNYLQASLDKVSASAIRLYGDNAKQMALTSAQQKQYLTMAALFFQLKKKTLAQMATKLKFNLSKWDPMDQLHASISNKKYSVTMQEGMFNIDVQSESFPAPQPVAKLFTVYGYYQDSLNVYQRVANTLQNGLNSQDYTVVAQVDADQPEFFWVRPQESLSKMTSFKNSQVTLYKKH